jgi:hypothetical protein
VEGTPDELAEFAALSGRVADKRATDEERARWRALRAKLVAPSPTPPGGQPREHSRGTRKARFHYAVAAEMAVSFAEELGGGGMRMKMNRHVDEGSVVVVRLELGPGEPLTVVARVAWSRRTGGHFSVGLEFLSLRHDERERIEAYTHAIVGEG